LDPDPFPGFLVNPKSRSQALYDKKFAAKTIQKPEKIMPITVMGWESIKTGVVTVALSRMKERMRRS
jgi:hypothetical protein